MIRWALIVAVLGIYPIHRMTGWGGNAPAVHHFVFGLEEAADYRVIAGIDTLVVHADADGSVEFHARVSHPVVISSSSLR